MGMQTISVRVETSKTVWLSWWCSGDSYPLLLSFNFRCGKTSIPQVCRGIAEYYRDETFKLVKRAILVTDKRRFRVNDKLG